MKVYGTKRIEGVIDHLVMIIENSSYQDVDDLARLNDMKEELEQALEEVENQDQQFHEHDPKDKPPHPSKQMMNRFYRR